METGAKNIKYNEVLISVLEMITAHLKCGTSNVTDEDARNILNILNDEIGTEDAMRYLNVSRNVFFDKIKPKVSRRKIAATILYRKSELEKLKNLL